MPPRTRLLALTLAWLLVASVGLAPIAPVGATHAGNADGTPITDCTTVSQSGQYALADDLTAAANSGTCLVVDAPDVTVDGQGHTVNGSATTGQNGISVLHGNENVTLRNLSVTAWGIGIAAANGTTVENAHVHDLTGTGVDVSQADNVSIRNSTFEGVQRPISVDQSTGTAIIGNSIEGGEIALNLFGTASDVATTRIEDNVIRNASRRGLSLRGDINGSVVRNNTLGGASAADFYVPVSTGTATIEDTRLPHMTVASVSGEAFSFRAVRDPPADPPGASNVSIYGNVSANGQGAVANLSVAYDDTGVDEANLTVWRHHDGRWVNETANASIDTVANRIGLEMRAFSVLAPMERVPTDDGGDGSSGLSVPSGSSGESGDDVTATAEPTASATATPEDTATSTRTPGSTPTERASATPTDEGTSTEAETDAPTATERTTASPTATPGQPGFGIAVAIVALLLAVAIRRRK